MQKLVIEQSFFRRNSSETSSTLLDTSRIVKTLIEIANLALWQKAGVFGKWGSEPKIIAKIREFKTNPTMDELAKVVLDYRSSFSTDITQDFCNLITNLHNFISKNTFTLEEISEEINEFLDMHNITMETQAVDFESELTKPQLTPAASEPIAATL